MATKAEYLKKYLSNDNEKKKEKKKKRKTMKHSNVIIHDDDVDWRTLVPKPEDEIEEDDPGKMIYKVRNNCLTYLS